MNEPTEISKHLRQLIHENAFLNNPDIIPSNVCRTHIQRGLQEKAFLLCKMYEITDTTVISQLWNRAMAIFRQQSTQLDFTRTNNTAFQEARECAITALEKAFSHHANAEFEDITEVLYTNEHHENNKKYLDNLIKSIREIDQYCEDFQKTLEPENQLFFIDKDTGKIKQSLAYEPKQKMFVKKYNQLQSIRNCLNQPMPVDNQKIENPIEKITQQITHLENNITNATKKIQSEQTKKLLPSNFLDKLIMLFCKLASIFSESTPKNFVYLQSQLSQEYHSRKKLAEKLQQFPEKLNKSTDMNYTEIIS